MIWFLILVVCILMVFVFSAFETGYILCRRKDFVGIAGKYRKFLLNAEEVITTVLVGLNFFESASSIVAFWFLKGLGLEAAESIGISGIIISLSLLLSEFFAKNLARERSSAIVKFFAPFIFMFSYLAIPVNRVILLMLFPIRLFRGERKKEAAEIIKLLVSDSVRDGELDSERARLILFLSRWQELKLKEFAEPVDRFVIDVEDLVKNPFRSNGPILISENNKILGLVDFKKFLLTRNVKSSIVSLPVLSGDLPLEKAIGKLKETGSKFCLVDVGKKIMLFRFSRFLKVMVEG
ncbi:MAG: CNNM domain-containing protein [bacterium]|nr:CNNM domain-containing protein [bacterium]